MCGYETNLLAREAYRNLYRIVGRKDDTVTNVLGTVPSNVSFRRGLMFENQNAWFDLVSKVVHVHLLNGRDVFKWNLNRNGMFTIRSMYNSLIRDGVLPEKNPYLEIKSTTNL
jgi:hypothetical protein